MPIFEKNAWREKENEQKKDCKVTDKNSTRRKEKKKLYVKK